MAARGRSPWSSSIKFCRLVELEISLSVVEACNRELLASSSLSMFVKLTRCVSCKFSNFLRGDGGTSLEEPSDKVYHES